MAGDVERPEPERPEPDVERPEPERPEPDVERPEPSGCESESAVCDLCGAIATDGRPVTWTTAVENGRAKSFCESCTRTYLRSIEGKLDSEWW